MHQRQVLLNELDKKGESLAKFVGRYIGGADPELQLRLSGKLRQGHFRGGPGYRLCGNPGQGRQAVDTSVRRTPADKEGSGSYRPVMQGADTDRHGKDRVHHVGGQQGDLRFSDDHCRAFRLHPGRYLADHVPAVRLIALKPIEKLKDGHGGGCSGDLTVSAEVINGDEIGDLGPADQRDDRPLPASSARSSLVGKHHGRFQPDCRNVGGRHASSRTTATTAEQAAKNNESAASAVEETSATMQEMSRTSRTSHGTPRTSPRRFPKPRPRSSR